MAGPRITEGWGGNRVYNGGAWMELYWALSAELNGDPTWSLTSNGKIPNQNSSVWARFKVLAVFDANTLDNSNTFKMSPGSSFPNFSGAVSIPTVKETRIYNDRVLVYPFFGDTYNLRAICSLTGIERVPGITSFDRWVSIPPRAWAKPDVPAVVSASVNNSTNKLTLTISGHQTNAGQDKYWQRTDWTIRRSEANDSWTETNVQPGNLSSYTWDVVPNQQYYVGARTWNEDGGLSAWTPWKVRYSKPATPSGLTATRNASQRTTVQLAWTNNAPYANKFTVQRLTSGTWVSIGAPTTNTWTDTDRPLSEAPQYRVMAQTPDNNVSDVSTAVNAPLGYTTPDAPSALALSLVDPSTARLTIFGSVTNPALEKYWANIKLWLLEEPGGADQLVHTTPDGSTTSYDFTSLAANSRYTASAASVNAAGESSRASSNSVYTAPSAPTSVTAARVGESSQVTVSWTSTANYVGTHRVLRSTDGGPFVQVGTSGTTSFTDTLNTASFASYAVVTDTPAPVASSVQSAPSGTVPTVSFVKENIPGIDQIYAGTTKVFRVMAGTNQIWLG